MQIGIRAPVSRPVLDWRTLVTAEQTLLPQVEEDKEKFIIRLADRKMLVKRCQKILLVKLDCHLLWPDIKVKERGEVTEENHSWDSQIGDRQRIVVVNPWVRIYCANIWGNIN